MPTTDHGLTYWTREEWGAKHGQGSARNPEQAVDTVVVHHTLRPTLACGQERAQEVALLRGIEKYHTDPPREWSGIGYNWLIFQSGNVYEGRGWKRVGAHAGPANRQSVGVAFVIDGSETVPSPAAMEAFRAILAAAPHRERMTPDYEITGHRDWMARDCPGDRVYEAVVQGAKRDRPTLRRGNLGPDVERLQRALVRAGTLADEPDGIFGSRTEAAVREYQASHGLEVDGVVGPDTWGSLLG